MRLSQNDGFTQYMVFVPVGYQAYIVKIQILRRPLFVRYHSIRGSSISNNSSLVAAKVSFW